MNKQQRIDKQTFKQIFSEHYPRYKDEDIEEVVHKMLNCAEKENGYATYKCMKCGEGKILPFICKSFFCLSCVKIKLEEWLVKAEGKEKNNNDKNY